MQRTGLARRVAGGAVWSFCGHIGGRLMVLVGLTVLARFLTPHDFGLFGMAVVAVNFFEVSRDLGLRRALIYFGHSDDPRSVYQTGFFLTMGIGVVLSLIVF